MDNASRALQRRLETDTLKPEDKEKLELARELRRLRKQGLSFRECSERMGQTEARLEKFARRQSFATFCRYLETLEKGTNEEATAVVVRKAKQEFAAFAPDTIAYYRTCFERNPPEDQAEKGEFKDDAKAMWASERVSKGLGLTEPDTAVRPVVQINIAHIRMEQAMVAADDAEAAAVQKAIDVTPT